MRRAITLVLVVMSFILLQECFASAPGTEAWAGVEILSPTEAAEYEGTAVCTGSCVSQGVRPLCVGTPTSCQSAGYSNCPASVTVEFSSVDMCVGFDEGTNECWYHGLENCRRIQLCDPNKQLQICEGGNTAWYQENNDRCKAPQ